jgi:hypothetical protein
VAILDGPATTKSEDNPFNTKQISDLISARGKAAEQLEMSKHEYDRLLTTNTILRELYDELKDNEVAIPKGKRGIRLSTVLDNIEEGFASGFYELIEDRAMKDEFEFEWQWQGYAVLTLKRSLVNNPRGEFHTRTWSERRRVELMWVIWKTYCGLALDDGAKLKQVQDTVKRNDSEASKRAKLVLQRTKSREQKTRELAASYTSGTAEAATAQSSSSKGGARKAENGKSQPPKGNTATVATTNGKGKAQSTKGAQASKALTKGKQKSRPRKPVNSHTVVNSTRVPKTATDELRMLLAQDAKARARWAAEQETAQKPVSEFTREELMDFMDREVKAQFADLWAHTKERREAEARGGAELQRLLEKDLPRFQRYVTIRGYLCRAVERTIEDYKRTELTDDIKDALLGPYKVHEEFRTDAAQVGLEEEQHEDAGEAVTMATEKQHYQDMIGDITEPLPEVQTVFQQWNSMANSHHFQEDNLKEALKLCRITDAKYRYLPHQLHRIQLRWHQLCAILWAKKIRIRNGGLGGLCTDAIGTGKSYVILGIILLVSFLPQVAYKGATDFGKIYPPIVTLTTANMRSEHG